MSFSSQALAIITSMEVSHLDEAIELLEKANADLEPELMTVTQAKERLATYARAQRLVAYGVAALARRVDDAGEVARATGTSMGRAKDTVATGKVMSDSGVLGEALKGGEVSLEQATEIARAEASAPGSAEELVSVAKEGSFHVLRDKALKTKLEAEQHRDLAGRQRAARSAGNHTDPLGMIDIHLRFEPHVGVPIVARAEAQASRLFRKAKKENRHEPYERHLADAYAEMLSGSSVKGPAKRPELVVLVSHSVVKRGWKDVKEGEICKIPGVGPVSPHVAREIAQDAFLSGVLYDGKDLRHFRRWTRNIPIEVRIALELGPPPTFDGIRCARCGNRFRTEIDHVEPHVGGGLASTHTLDPLCRSCHLEKTEEDRKAGKLTPPEP